MSSENGSGPKSPTAVKQFIASQELSDAKVQGV